MRSLGAVFLGRLFSAGAISRVRCLGSARGASCREGPSIGKAGGVEYHEDLLDWQAEDCRALDAADDVVALGDGEDASRDLVALYERREGRNVFLRADLLDLALGAEMRGALVLGFL